MQEKTKTQADRQLIKTLLAVDPIDWARYPDGTLSFISPTGQKFKYSQQMIAVIQQDIADSKIAAKKAAAKKASAKKAKKLLITELEPKLGDPPGAAAE